MLIWFYGSTMILGAAVTMEDGVTPQGGATVTYGLHDKAGTELYSGTLEELGATPGTYEDTIEPDELFGEYWEEENPEVLRRQLHEARIVATLPSGVIRESRPRLQLLFDTD